MHLQTCFPSQLFHIIKLHHLPQLRHQNFSKTIFETTTLKTPKSPTETPNIFAPENQAGWKMIRSFLEKRPILKGVCY